MADLLIEHGSEWDKFLGNPQDGPLYAALLAAIQAGQSTETPVAATQFLYGQGLANKDVLEAVETHLQPVPPVQ